MEKLRFSLQDSAITTAAATSEPNDIFPSPKFDLVDNTPLSPTVFAVGLAKEYAMAAAIAMNLHADLIKALRLCETALADYGDRHHGGIKFDACMAARSALTRASMVEKLIASQPETSLAVE